MIARPDALRGPPDHTSAATTARAGISAPTRQRELGAFYTPDELASALVRWALPSGAGRVLDPSFGGCSFLKAALDAAAPGALELYGVDIDDAAMPIGLDLAKSTNSTIHLVHKDFLGIEPLELGGRPFDALVGNPPYVRHHWFSAEQRNKLAALLTSTRTELSRRANLWAYFLLHSLRFVDTGGRLAFVLPGSLLHADYSAQVLRSVAAHAWRIHVMRLGERLFSDADESSVLLLAEGMHQGPGQLRYAEYSTSSVAEDELIAGTLSTRPLVNGARRLLPSGPASAAAEEIFDIAMQHSETKTLGDVARIRIGIVTGANAFFVRTADEAARLVAAGATVVPAVTRARDLPALALTTQDIDRFAVEGRRVFLILLPKAGAQCSALRTLIREGEAEGLHLRRHTRTRGLWYQLPDLLPPDAFLPYMGAVSPVIVLNNAEAACTNGIHRLWWTDDVSPSSASLTSLTTLFGFAAELHGRHYGGGVLKLEPSEAARMPVVACPEADEAFSCVETLIRGGDPGTATELANKIVLQEALGLTAKEVRTLAAGRAMLAERRRLGRRRLSA